MKENKKMPLNKMKIEFDKKENLDYFLSKEGDHAWWLSLYHYERLNDTILMLDISFNQLLTAQNKQVLFSYRKFQDDKILYTPFPVKIGV